MGNKSIINFCCAAIILFAGSSSAGAQLPAAPDQTDNEWNYYFDKGMIQFNGERYDFALENFISALDRNPKLFEAANRIADIHRYKNRLREALEYYNQSLEINEGQAETHNRAGEINEFFGYHEKSFGHYRRAVEIDPSLLRARLNIVRHLVRRKEYTLADEQFKICYEKGKPEGDRYFSEAAEKERRGKIRDAIRLYQAALQKNPVMIEALFSLAEIHRRRGDADAAALYLEKIKEIKPDTEKAYIYLGHLYYAKRHARNRAYILALAIKNLKQAEDLNPDNYETLYLLSDIYRHMGDDVRADEYRARAMDLEKRSGEPEFKRGN